MELQDRKTTRKLKPIRNCTLRDIEVPKKAAVPVRKLPEDKTLKRTTGNWVVLRLLRDLDAGGPGESEQFRFGVAVGERLWRGWGFQ